VLDQPPLSSAREREARRIDVIGEAGGDVMPAGGYTKKRHLRVLLHLVSSENRVIRSSEASPQTNEVLPAYMGRSFALKNEK